MEQVRCNNCNKLLFYADDLKGKIEIKCTRCKKKQKIVK